MDIAIVTGASSSLGLAISRRLIQLGFRVYGLGGDYKDCDLQNVNFRPVSCDLADPAAIEVACGNIITKEKGVYLLVNNAKYFGQAPFEQMQLADIERIMRINLLCPLVLMRVLAESLKSLQGYLIQIGAPYAESSIGGAAGAASAGGLKWMGEMLFNEYRASGVRVCHLSPEPNRARDARIRFRKGARPEATIDPEAIAQAVEQILQSPYGNVVTEMVIRPLRIDEPDLEPVRKIPYPDPQPIPYTIPREMVEAEEQLEEEEWKEKQQKRKLRKNRKSTDETSESDQEKPELEKPVPVGETTDAKAEPAAPAQPQTRRKSRRKPKPPRVTVGFHHRQPDKTVPEMAAAKEPVPEQAAVKKTARKTAITADGKPASDKDNKQDTAGAAKKATRQPRKKVPAKKAAKKAAANTTAKKATRKRTRKASPETGTEKKND